MLYKILKHDIVDECINGGVICSCSVFVILSVLTLMEPGPYLTFVCIVKLKFDFFFFGWWYNKYIG